MLLFASYCTEKRTILESANYFCFWSKLLFIPLIFFSSDTGNKEVMDEVQILQDYLYGVTEIREGGNLIVDSTPKEPLIVYADDYTECLQECKDR